MFAFNCRRSTPADSAAGISYSSLRLHSQLLPGFPTTSIDDISRRPSSPGHSLASKRRCCHLTTARRALSEPQLSTSHSAQSQSFLTTAAHHLPDSLDAFASVSPQVSPKTIPRPSPSTLRACHICLRRPTTKVALGAYGDCEACGQRTCYVCIRQCDGRLCSTFASGLDGSTWLISDKAICSYCATEGSLGDGKEYVRCPECSEDVQDILAIPIGNMGATP